MRVVPISSLDRWQTYQIPWNLMTRGVPFRGFEWLTTWWRHYGSGHDLAVLAVVDQQNAIVGAAPWYLEQVSSRGRVLRALGSGEVCSDHSTILCSPDFEQPVCESLAQWLVNECDSRHWDVLELECVSACDSAVLQLVQNLESAGCSTLNTPGQSLWSIPLPSTWPEYLAQLSKSHRKQISRQLRKYWDTGRAKLVVAQNDEQLQRGLRHLVELHQRRWQHVGQPGVFASRRYSDFLHDAAARLLAAQALQLSLLELDDRPAAVDFHLLNRDTNYVYQGGIEPQLVEESPGKLLTALLIQNAISAGRKTFDFLRGDEPYKPHFRARPTKTINRYVVPRRVAARLRHGWWATGLAVRSLVKSGKTLAGL